MSQDPKHLSALSTSGLSLWESFDGPLAWWHDGMGRASHVALGSLNISCPSYGKEGFATSYS